MNVTNVPAHIVLSASLDEMLTDGVKFPFTVVVMVVDVTVAELTQVSELVITALTTSPSASEVVEKVEELVLTITSLMSHS